MNRFGYYPMSNLRGNECRLQLIVSFVTSSSSRVLNPPSCHQVGRVSDRIQMLPSRADHDFLSIDVRGLDFCLQNPPWSEDESFHAMCSVELSSVSSTSLSSTLVARSNCMIGLEMRGPKSWRKWMVRLLAASGRRLRHPTNKCRLRRGRFRSSSLSQATDATLELRLEWDWWSPWAFLAYF